jgi:hypothetical protein
MAIRISQKVAAAMVAYFLCSPLSLHQANQLKALKLRIVHSREPNTRLNASA